jgi:hypothetical protein
MLGDFIIFRSMILQTKNLFNPIISPLTSWVVTHFINESVRRHQQLQNRFEPDALLADERHSVDFRTVIAVGSHKSQGDDLSCPRMLSKKARMLLGSRFTFPLPGGAGVASDRVKEWTAAVQLAIVQYYDVDIADVCAIQKLCADFIKPVLNHIAAPVLGEKLMRRMVILQRTQIIRHVAKFSQDGRVAEITGRWIARAAECDCAGMT